MGICDPSPCLRCHPPPTSTAICQRSVAWVRTSIAQPSNHTSLFSILCSSCSNNFSRLNSNKLNRLNNLRCNYSNKFKDNLVNTLRVPLWRLRT